MAGSNQNKFEHLHDKSYADVGLQYLFTFQVVSPPKDLKKPRGKKCHFVKFFGTEDQ